MNSIVHEHAFDLFVFLVLLCSFFLLRVLVIIKGDRRKLRSFDCEDEDAVEDLKNVKGRGRRLLCVCGSGGHTAEMLKILRSFERSNLRKMFRKRAYVLASTDCSSLHKIESFEESLLVGTGNDDEGKKAFEILRVPRAREVKQSYFTSIFTTMNAFVMSFWHYVSVKPALVLANGPGTCVPVIASAFVLKVFGFNSLCKVIYVESVARTKRLSLSGYLCYHLRIVDVVFVMWPELLEKYPRAKYCGRIY